MLEFLNKLISEGSYEKCLDSAEQLVFSGKNSLVELIELNLVIARCRLWMRDYLGAVPSAQLGFKMAKDQGRPDLVLKALWVIGGAYLYTRQYDNLAATAFQYYELVPAPWQSPADEGKVWNLIALAHYFKQQNADALSAFLRSAASFRLAKDQEAELRTLIWVVRCAHAESDFAQARAALAEAMRLARTFPKDKQWLQAVLVQRSEHAFRTGRAERGAYLSLRAVALDGAPEPKIRALMLLHRYHLDLGEFKDALGYALAARVTALESRWFHLEYEAAEAMVQTMQAASAQDVVELDQEYLSTGVDIARYLPDSVLRHRT